MDAARPSISQVPKGLQMDWIPFFCPVVAAREQSPDNMPEPVVFQNKSHFLEVLEKRGKLKQILNHPDDKFLCDTRDEIGTLGMDRTGNSVEKKDHDLGMFEDFEDEDTELPEGWLQQELEEFRRRRYGAVILSFPAIQAQESAA